MDCEGFVLWVPGSSRLKSSDIGTVAKFRLSIAANDLVIFGRFQKLLFLFRCSLSINSDLFH